jgi:hypothetical protein
LSIFTTILASRIGSWQHYLKITSIALQVSMTLVKTDLGFLRIIQKFKIVGRRPTITRSYAKDKIRGFQLFKVYGNNPIRLYKFIDSSKSQFIDKDLKVNTIYGYALKAIFDDGSESELSEIIKVEY